MINIPIHPRYLKVLRAMTKQYCKGKLKKYSEGVMTCPKARSVFYATMRAKKIDYTKAPTEETVLELESNLLDIDKMIEWYLKHELQ